MDFIDPRAGTIEILLGELRWIALVQGLLDSGRQLLTATSEKRQLALELELADFHIVESRLARALPEVGRRDTVAEICGRELRLLLVVEARCLEHFRIRRPRPRNSDGEAQLVRKGRELLLELRYGLVIERNDPGIANHLERAFGNVRSDVGEQQLVRWQACTKEPVQRLAWEAHVSIRAQALCRRGAGQQPRVPAGGAVQNREVLPLGIFLRGGELFQVANQRRYIFREPLVLRCQRLEGSRSSEIEHRPRISRKIIQGFRERYLVAGPIDGTDLQAQGLSRGIVR